MCRLFHKVEMIFFNHLARHDLSFGPDEFVNNDTRTLSPNYYDSDECVKKAAEMYSACCRNRRYNGTWKAVLVVEAWP